MVQITAGNQQSCLIKVLQIFNLIQLEYSIYSFLLAVYAPTMSYFNPIGWNSEIQNTNTFYIYLQSQIAGWR